MIVVLGCRIRRDSEQMIADVGARHAIERAGRPATTGAALRPRLSRRSPLMQRGWARQIDVLRTKALRTSASARARARARAAFAGAIDDQVREPGKGSDDE